MQKTQVILRVAVAAGILGICTTASLEAVVSAIQPGEHPRLYFNTQEIEALRRAILVDRQPTYAVSTYDAIKNTAPRSKPSNMDSLGWPDSYSTALPCTIDNMKACFSYMIEPTTAKATALRNALVSWTARFGPYWTTDPQGGGHIQYALPWMYDLLYNSGALSAADKQQCEVFFSSTANQLVRPNSYWASRGRYSIDKEGSLRYDYENWRQWEFHAGAIAALVSKNQDLVNRAFVTTVPEDHFTDLDLAQFAPSTRDMKNMINGLVYPSGYNFDGYHRVYGFNAPVDSFAGQNSGEGQHYHFFALLPCVFGAEAASHNGFDAWSYAQEALKRSFVRGRAWAPTAYHAGVGRDYNWLPAYWILYRHFPNDPTIRDAVQQSGAYDALPYILGNACPLWGALGDIVVSSAPPQPPASAPLQLTAIPGDGRATLSWQSVNGATGYAVYRGTVAAGTLLFISSAAATTFTDTGLTNGTTYFYAVAAYNNAGTGPRSAAVSVVPQPSQTVFSSVPYYGDVLNYEPLTAARWSVVADEGDLRLFLNTSAFGPGTGDGLGEYTLVRNRTFGDCTITARVKSNESFSANPSADYAVVFGFTDPANYCYVMFNRTAAFTQLFRMYNASRIALATATVSGIPDNGYHTVTISRTGTHVHVLLDGASILIASSSLLEATGRVGIGSYNDSAYFDDISVTSSTNLSPTVILLQPVHGASVPAPGTFVLQAAASDPDGTVSAVRFYANGTFLAQQTASPYVFTWNDIAAGTYTITASATDDRSATGTSAPVTVYVHRQETSRPPEVTLVQPVDHSTYSAPAAVSLEASVADDGTVAQVSFYAGSTLLATVPNSPYTWTWREVTAGTYQLYAVALDTTGLTGTSPAVFISVVSSATAQQWCSLTVAIDPPGAGAVIPSSGMFLQGSTISLNAVPHEPYVFSRWSGAATSTHTPLILLVSTHVALTAHFEYRPPANLPPTVTLISPVDGSTASVTAAIPLEAAAEDPDGVITAVSWWVGTTRIAETTQAPYRSTWVAQEPGIYAVYASVTDDGGATALSRAHTISVVNPSTPVVWRTLTITIEPPTAGYAQPGGGTFPDGTTVTVRAVAYPGWHFDAWTGNFTSTSPALPVLMDRDITLTAHFSTVSYGTAQPPTVAILSPVPGATFTAPASLPVSVTATDVDGTITSITVYLNNRIAGTLSTASGTVTIPDVPAGVHTITAKATDSDALDGWSDEVTVTVNPPTPPPDTAPGPTPDAVTLRAGAGGYLNGSTRDVLVCTVPVNRPGTVHLAIYSLRGRRMHVQSHRAETPGSFTLTWNPWRTDAEPPASGLYLVVVRTPSETVRRTVAIIR